MAKTTEQKLVLSAPEGAKITRVKIADDGKSVEIILTTEVVQELQAVAMNNKEFDILFPIINPSELIGHKLLEHEPQSDRQMWLKGAILQGINQNLPAFRVPCMEPSEKNGKIVFEAGNMPAIRHSPEWWSKTGKEYMPEKNSRIGTDLHWAAFCGQLMKYLVEQEWFSVEGAWEAICDDSFHLGNYWYSERADNSLKPTGRKKVGKFCDLANAHKIIEKWGASKFLLAGGFYYSESFFEPLASLDAFDHPDYGYPVAVGWLILDV